MSRIAFLDNVFQGKYCSFFAALYKRNKTILIVSTALFFSSIFLGYILSGPIDPFATKVLGSLKGKFSKEGINTISIFLNNIKSALLTYIGGLTGIITVGSLFVNGIIIGYVIAKYPISILYIFPHGIFEIPALILSGAAGFRITSMVIKILISLSKDKPINRHYWEFKDSLTLFAIAIVLFIIAAIIEANITLGVGNYIRSII